MPGKTAGKANHRVDDKDFPRIEGPGRAVAAKEEVKQGQEENAENGIEKETQTGGKSGVPAKLGENNPKDICRDEQESENHAAVGNTHPFVPVYRWCCWWRTVSALAIFQAGKRGDLYPGWAGDASKNMASCTHASVKKNDPGTLSDAAAGAMLFYQGVEAGTR